MTTDIKKVKFSLRVPEHLNDILERISKNSGISKNSVILQILWDFAENSKHNI